MRSAQSALEVDTDHREQGGYPIGVRLAIGCSIGGLVDHGCVGYMAIGCSIGYSLWLVDMYSGYPEMVKLVTFGPKWGNGHVSIWPKPPFCSHGENGPDYSRPEMALGPRPELPPGRPQKRPKKG